MTGGDGYRWPRRFFVARLVTGIDARAVRGFRARGLTDGGGSLRLRGHTPIVVRPGARHPAGASATTTNSHAPFLPHCGCTRRWCRPTILPRVRPGSHSPRTPGSLLPRSCCGCCRRLARRGGHPCPALRYTQAVVHVVLHCLKLHKRSWRVDQGDGGTARQRVHGRQSHSRGRCQMQTTAAARSTCQVLVQSRD